MEKEKYSIADTFGIKAPKSVAVTGMAVAGEYVPAHEYEPNYHFREDLLRDVLAWWELASRGEGLFLTGPTGSGKSSVILQIAIRLKWPCQQITGHNNLEFSDFVGRPVIQKNGSMAFQYGPLAYAMKEGHLFLLDELDFLDPGVAAGLNGIIQGEPLTIPENGGERIVPNPDFRIVATGNTKGNGDGGMFAGTNRQNQALMDRFWVVEVDYMAPESEKSLLKSLTGHSDDIIDKLVAVATDIRQLYITDQIEMTLSTRVLIRIAKMVKFFYAVAAKDMSPLHYAFDRAGLFRAEPETREAVHEIVQRHFGE